MSLKLTSGEVREKKKVSSIIVFLAYTAVAILTVFIVCSIVSDNMQIQEYRKQSESLSTEISVVKESNAELQRYLAEDANLDEYIENIAREKFDYALPDERIYYIIPASEE